MEAISEVMEAGLWQQLAWRLPAAWAVPLLELLTGHGTDGVVIMLSIMSSAVLFYRRSGKGKIARNPMPVHAIWLLLVTFILIQLCCIAIRAVVFDDETVYVHGPAGKTHVSKIGEFNIDAPGNELRWSPNTISVILPCAQEGDHVIKTVTSIFVSVPHFTLKEIVVVDDGSNPPISKTGFTPGFMREFKVKLLRNEKTVGLIGSKKKGGDAATGDILVFFDCHVAPQEYWSEEIIKEMRDNYRRMLVPRITPLDVDTWSEHQNYNRGLAKCYLTFDADFKWYESEDDFIAVISGGLVAVSRLWWMQTGGLDTQMLGWGGENLDQSLRCWLCGGEIKVAKDARVAHMWRTGSDARTMARYTRVGDSKRNRARAVYGWYGDFADKLAHYPLFAHHRREWVGDLSPFQEVKNKLSGCRPFAWFLRRFKDLYEDGGMVPESIFMLKEVSSGRCLRYQRQAGTSSDGKGTASLEECDPKDHRYYWHDANKDARSKLNRGKCCSGLKAWNTDQCIWMSEAGALSTRVCDVSGNNPEQDWEIKDGRMMNSAMKGRAKCIGPDLKESWKLIKGELREEGCSDFKGSLKWEKINAMMPLEGQLYRKAQREYPALFGNLGVQKKALAVPPMPQACITPADKNATCVQIFATDGTGRCLDEAGLLTTAKKYCSQYRLLGMCPTCPVEGDVRGIESVALPGRCFDSMGDHYNETWDLEICRPADETDLMQMFTRKGSSLCLADRAKSAGTACFEFKVIEPAAPQVIT